MSDNEPQNEPINLLELPEDILQDMLLLLDGNDLGTCRLINRAFNAFIITNTALLLHATLYKYALQIPPSVLATTPAATLLSTLRERVTRFRNITPSSNYVVELEADEGRLYEYLEGVLLRGSGIPPGPQAFRTTATPLPSAVTVYDLTVEKEWETIEVSKDDAALPLQEEEEEEVEIIEESAPSSSRTVKRRKVTSAFSTTRSTVTDDQIRHRHNYDDESDEEIVIADGDDADSYIKRKWFPNPQEFAAASRRQGGQPGERDNRIKDIAMEPGNDLFVVARTEIVPLPPALIPVDEDRPTARRLTSQRLHIHCLSLTTFQPHPWAVNARVATERGERLAEDGNTTTLEDVFGQMTSLGSLVIQICDEKIFMYASGATDHAFGNARIVCWNWHTGQKIFVRSGRNFKGCQKEQQTQLHGRSFQTIEDFILLSHNIFATAVFSTTQIPDQDDEDFELLTQLVIYGLKERRDPVNSPSDKRRASHEVKELVRLELPTFNVIATISIRADPPPRPSFPTIKPLSFYPKPESGLILLSFDCGFVRDFRRAYYTLFILKETLLKFIPAGAMEMLKSSDPAVAFQYRIPTISFEELAPHCRLKNDIEPQGWVTYIYHYRFVSTITRDPPRRNPFIPFPLVAPKYIRLNDFDPVAASRLLLARKYEQAQSKGKTMDEIRDTDVEGADDDGVDLVVGEDVIEEGLDEHVVETYRTGSKFPYIVTKTAKAELYSGVMIDDSRIVTLTEREGNMTAFLEVMSM